MNPRVTFFQVLLAVLLATSACNPYQFHNTPSEHVPGTEEAGEWLLERFAAHLGVDPVQADVSYFWYEGDCLVVTPEDEFNCSHGVTITHWDGTHDVHLLKNGRTLGDTILAHEMLHVFLHHVYGHGNSGHTWPVWRSVLPQVEDEFRETWTRALTPR